jgi:hypothetical protein
MRTLTDNEAQLLAKILGAGKGATGLLGQISAVQVADDSTPTCLSLTTPEALRVEGFRDGPLPGRFPVTHDGEIVGEVLVWLEDGRQAGLEYAWVTDDAPTGMPNPADVDVEGA